MTKVSDFINHNFYFISYPHLAGGTHLRNLMSLDADFNPLGAKSHDEYYQYLLDWYSDIENATAHISIDNKHHTFSTNKDLFMNYLDSINFNGYKKSVHIGHAIDFLSEDILDVFLQKFMIVLTINDKKSYEMLKRREMLRLGYYTSTNVDTAPIVRLEKQVYSRWHYVKYFNYKDKNIFELEVQRLFDPNILPVIDNINQTFGLNIPLDRAQEIHTLWHNKLWI
jgi:hypothetical protein